MMTASSLLSRIGEYDGLEIRRYIKGHACKQRTAGEKVWEKLRMTVDGTPRPVRLEVSKYAIDIVSPLITQLCKNISHHIFMVEGATVSYLKVANAVERREAARLLLEQHLKGERERVAKEKESTQTKVRKRKEVERRQKELDKARAEL